MVRGHHLANRKNAGNLNDGGVHAKNRNSRIVVIAARRSDAGWLVKTVTVLAIDYLRWTQLAPMITAWALGLAMLLAIVFVSNEEAAWGLFDAFAHGIVQLPWLGDLFVSKMESLAGDDGTIELGGEELKAAALKVWGIGATDLAKRE